MAFPVDNAFPPTPPDATSVPGVAATPSVTRRPASGRRRLVAILAVLGSLAIVAIVVLIVVRTNRHAAPTPVAAPQRTTTAPTEPPAKNLTPESRDLQRFNDVNVIKIALETMYDAEHAYPDSLDALMPKYLSSVPHDPSDGSSYAYEKLDQTFKISFTLENGIFALPKGPHFLTPDGIDVESKPVPPPPPPTVSVHVIPAPTNAPTSPLPPEPGQVAYQDSDNDGLSDADEAKLGTDPHNPDTDGDGISDGDEVHVYHTDPRNPDSDGDGYSDSEEIKKGYEPNGPGRMTPERQAQIQNDIATYGLHSTL